MVEDRIDLASLQIKPRKSYSAKSVLKLSEKSVAKLTEEFGDSG